MEFLEAIDKKVSIEDKYFADTPITETNLFESLKKMKNDKAPGPDGLTKEWYFTFWDIIKGDLLNCVREIESKGELSEMQKKLWCKNLLQKRGSQINKKL